MTTCRVFLEECVVPDLHAMIVKKEFRTVYGEWCDRQGVHRLSDFAIKEALKEFQPRLDECREDSANKYSPMCWLGIAWSQDAADYMSATFTDATEGRYERACSTAYNQAKADLGHKQPRIE